MDVGTTNGWNGAEVVPAAEVLARVSARHPVEPLEPTYPGEVAARYRFLDGQGELGLIGSVTRPFCRSCTRARLTAVGELYTCLFAARGRDVRGLLRGGATDEQLLQAIGGVWAARTDRYSELRAQGHDPSPRAEMSYLGG